MKRTPFHHQQVSGPGGRRGLLRRRCSQAWPSAFSSRFTAHGRKRLSSGSTSAPRAVHCRLAGSHSSRALIRDKDEFEAWLALSPEARLERLAPPGFRIVTVP
jgi:hypothetical protein